ncbi:uncharacterized protein BDZ99DRAFT_516225 [Mytilinidion resinicola]|uniref:Uncharacterized protein n=1 Tax=Mytilinidion resinicola TaxID=574789 RepID=A0A6A6Z3X4_9PEZI|nr:uncharacterized protein BDZ99DRAFT_516225 [Mytilinidion resinicola]KAF2815508.1 hypothetical protein BDZ99DRAFT_516225 [Mytilinidion resinicola]
MFSANALTLSEKEMSTLALAWQCFATEPTVDYKKLAELTGYTLQSAQVTLGKIKRKLRAAADANGTPMAKATDSTATNTPKKRKNANGDGNGSPKKARTPKKKAAAATESHSDDDETFSSKFAVKGEADKLIKSTNDFLGIKPEDDEE